MYKTLITLLLLNLFSGCYSKKKPVAIFYSKSCILESISNDVTIEKVIYFLKGMPADSSIQILYPREDHLHKINICDTLSSLKVDIDKLMIVSFFVRKGNNINQKKQLLPIKSNFFEKDTVVQLYQVME